LTEIDDRFVRVKPTYAEVLRSGLPIPVGLLSRPFMDRLGIIQPVAGGESAERRRVKVRWVRNPHFFEAIQVFKCHRVCLGDMGGWFVSQFQDPTG
jgi:hypothetical protein